MTELTIPGAFESFLRGSGLADPSQAAGEDGAFREAQQAYFAKTECRAGRGHQYTMHLTPAGLDIIRDYALGCIDANLGGTSNPSELRAARRVLADIDHWLPR